MRIPGTNFRIWEGEAPAEPNASLEQLSRSFALLSVLAILLACGGCWEEIHYKPPIDAAEKPAERTEAEEESVADVGEPQAADPLVEPAEAPPPPGADELFSPELSAEASMAVADHGVGTDDAAPPEDSILPTPPGTVAGDEAPGAATEEGGGGRRGDLAEPTAEERRLAWEAASKWSLAAAIHAKGLEASRYEPILNDARAAATKLGVELPPLPTTAQAGDLEAIVIEGLHGESAVTLVNLLAERLDQTAGATADLAVRSHLLLLTYTPRSSDATLQAEALRRAAEASGLPADVWEPLVKLVEERAAFVDVRQAVFELDNRVAKHLGDAGAPATGAAN